MKGRLIGKDPNAGKDWGQEEKGMIEGEMVGWHHQLNGHEFEQALRNGEGQGSLACCSPWGHKEPDTTERLNNKKYSNKEDVSSTTTEVRVGIRNEIGCQAPYQFLKILKHFCFFSSSISDPGHYDNYISRFGIACPWSNPFFSLDSTNF